MKKFNVTIKMISPYLQARFSEGAKKELLKDARKSIVRKLSEEDLQWVQFSYFDDKGYYVPSEQIEAALVNSGKDFKMKARRTSLKEYVKATLFVVGDKNYINKKEPDELLVSYPKRKDGNRVRVIHPAFNSGLVIKFVLECVDDDFDDETIKELIENAGKRYGIGARRPKFGRFELIEFKKIK